MQTQTSNGKTLKTHVSNLSTKNRRQTLLLCCLIASVAAVLLTVWFLYSLAPAVAGHENGYETYQQIMVEPGDTLWKISARVAQGTDQSDVLEQILVYNNLETSELEIGQILYVPVVED